MLFFLKPEDVSRIYFLAAFAGSGLSTFYVMPWSIVPDAIEYHQLRTGQKIEGVFYGIWSFGPNLGSSLAGFTLGMGLTAFGYVPNLVNQSQKTLMGIHSIFCLFPTAIILIGVWVLSYYPITKKSLAELGRKNLIRQNLLPSQVFLINKL